MITDEHLSELRAIFVKHGVVLAYLFGSQAEGRAGPLSDIDLAALLAPEISSIERFRVQLDLIGDCGHLFQRNDVEVIILNEAPPLLAYEVIRNGKLLYEDPATQLAADFAAQAFSRYADTIPFRRLQQAYLFDRIERHKAARAKAAENT